MGQESQVIRTLIVDDSALVRDFLAASLSVHERLEVVGTAVDGLDALEKASRLKPDLMVIDIEMPRMGGLEAARRFKAECPNTPILIISSHGDRYGQILAASVGADGFVAKTRQLPELLAKRISQLFAP